MKEKKVSRNKENIIFSGVPLSFDVFSVQVFNPKIKHTLSACMSVNCFRHINRKKLMMDDCRFHSYKHFSISGYCTFSWQHKQMQLERFICSTFRDKWIILRSLWTMSTNRADSFLIPCLFKPLRCFLSTVFQNHSMRSFGNSSRGSWSAKLKGIDPHSVTLLFSLYQILLGESSREMSSECTHGQDLNVNMKQRAERKLHCTVDWCSPTLVGMSDEVLQLESLMQKSGNILKMNGWDIVTTT